MGKVRRLTVEMVHQKITDKFNGKYKILNLDSYDGNPQIYVDVLCADCNTVFNMKLYGLLFEKHKCDCPTCRQNERKDLFIERVKKECGEEYLPLSEYKTCKDKVLFRHNKVDCMNEFWMTPDVFFNGGCRCSICSHQEGYKKLFLSHEEFEEKIKSIHGNHITLLGKYTGYSGKIKIRHEDCGREFEVTCGDLSQGKGCRYCAGTMLKTQEQFEEDIFNLYGEEYSVLGKYKNAKTKLKMRHNLCGYEWKVSPSAILKQRLCPNCGKSYGEKQIENFLIHNNVNYKTQTTFEECMDTDYLKFDFSIYDNNDTLLSLIEYDGEGHFMPVQFGGISLEEANENFVSQIRKDNIKNDFCERNNIPLLRISYKEEKDLFNILNEYLSNLLDRNMNNPTNMHLDTLKSPCVKFIEMVEKLPNGVYPKSFFKEKLLNENQNFSHHITLKSIVQSYIQENNITIGRAYILIDKNESDDYDSYLKIGTENSFDFDLFQHIKELHNLEDGVYARFKINLQKKATVCPSNYDFYNRYLKSRNIKICHSYIRVNSEETFKRPDWLLKDRQKEAV